MTISLLLAETLNVLYNLLWEAVYDNRTHMIVQDSAAADGREVDLEAGPFDVPDAGQNMSLFFQEVNRFLAKPLILLYVDILIVIDILH